MGINLTSMIPFEGQMTNAMRKHRHNKVFKTRIVDDSLYIYVEDKSKTAKSLIRVLKSDTKKIEEIKNRTKQP